MQSILSVFRRPSQPAASTTTQTQRRKSSSAVSPSTQVTPRHLHSEGESPSQSSKVTIPTSTEPPTSLHPPPPRSTSTSKAPPPPPPRSRQVSSQSIATTRSVSGPPPTTSNANNRPLYLAVYFSRKSGETLPGEAQYTLALHLRDTRDQSLRVYRLQPADIEPYSWTQIQYTMSEDEALSDPLMAGRVMVGYITAPITTTTDNTATSDAAQSSLEHILNTLALPPPHTSNTTYFKDALAALHAAGLLTTKPATTTALPPPPPSSTNISKPPTQRPSLVSRDTDNWNDIPETFLSPDFSTNGGSLGRRKVRGTPRVTPLVTPRGSMGSLRQTSVTSVAGGPPSVVGESTSLWPGGPGDGADVERSWDEIVKEIESLVSRYKEEK